MDASTLRAWWAHRQGLDGSLDGADPAEVLETSGWARSVGGAGPYLTMRTRAGSTRSEVDTAVAGLAIHELPAARGCTYLVPAAHYALALTVSQAAVDEHERATARRLGVTEGELDRLCTAVADALDEPLDATSLSELLGDTTTDTLAVALAVLQGRGRIRRVPVHGRLDQERYWYVRWDDGPLAAGSPFPSLDEARTELARSFLAWAGPASLAQLRSFTGMSPAEASAALAGCDAVPAPSAGERERERDPLLLADDLDAFLAFDPPTGPAVSLVAGTDGLFLLRQAPADHLADGDADHPLLKTGAADIVDLPCHAIVDRGRLVGLWEFDVDTGTIAWATFQAPTEAVRDAIATTEAWVHTELGDARSSRLDRPESRRSRIEALRAHNPHHP